MVSIWLECKVSVGYEFHDGRFLSIFTTVFLVPKTRLGRILPISRISEKINTLGSVALEMWALGFSQIWVGKLTLTH